MLLLTEDLNIFFPELVLISKMNPLETLWKIRVIFTPLTFISILILLYLLYLWPRRIRPWEFLIKETDPFYFRLEYFRVSSISDSENPALPKLFWVCFTLIPDALRREQWFFWVLFSHSEKTDPYPQMAYLPRFPWGLRRPIERFYFNSYYQWRLTV